MIARLGEDGCCHARCKGRQQRRNEKVGGKMMNARGQGWPVADAARATAKDRSRKGLTGIDWVEPGDAWGRSGDFA